MKRILLFLGFIGMVGIHSVSAQLAWGARVGLSYGVSSDDYYKGAPGIELGPTVYYALSGKVYLNSGLMLSFKNLSFSEYDEEYGESYEEKVNFMYLDLPVYLGYAFGTGNTTFYAQAGPVFGFNLSADAKSTYDGETETQNLKDGINSINAGLGVAFGVNIQKFKIELGYQHGLTNILKREYSDENVKLGSIFAGISYVF